MRYAILSLTLLALALGACRPTSLPSASPSPQASDPVPSATLASALYPDLGPAPELSNAIWLNTSEPLRLAGLRGKVVLIDMWTFG